MRFEMWKSKAQKGAWIVVAALMVPVFFLFGALAMDLGEIWAYHSKMQNAVDAAALAGAGHFSEAKGDQILDSIDTANHKHADDNAKVYLSQNLGDSLNQLNAAESNQMLLFQAQKTDDSHSYYRVEYTKPIPLMFLRYLKIGDFNVRAAAVALLPSPGKVTGKVTFDNLVNVGTEYLGSVNNNNQHGIMGATFDNGKVIEYNQADYEKNKNDFFLSRYYTSAAANKFRDKVDRDTSGKYYSDLTLGDHNDYMQKASDVLDATEALFKSHAGSVKTIISDSNHQSVDIRNNLGDSNYIHIISTFGTLNINLWNGNSSSNDPIYIYIDPQISEDYGGLDVIHLVRQEDIIRPVIIVYTEYNHGNKYWRPPEDQRGTKFKVENPKNANGKKYDFTGSIFAPYANCDTFDMEYGNFRGSMWFDKLKLQTNYGHFYFEEYGIPTSGGNSGSSSGTALRLVENDEVSWPETHHPHLIYQ